MPTTLHCLHDHPNGQSDPTLKVARRFGKPDAHGAEIVVLGFAVEWTGRVLNRWQLVAPDSIGACCKPCKRWTKYRVVLAEVA